MILFLDEDRPYLNWVIRHRDGFVIDCLRNRGKGPMTLHRAACGLVRQANSKRTHWTTGKRMKGCSLDLDELKRWSFDQCGRPAQLCAECRPGENDSEPGRSAPDHLTKLEQRIMSCILEIAAYHLEMDDHGYDVTVDMIAGFLGKTEGQLDAAFQRLVHDGMVDTPTGEGMRKKANADHRIFPTAKALRTIEEFALLDDEAILGELQKLQDRRAKPVPYS